MLVCALQLIMLSLTLSYTEAYTLRGPVSWAVRDDVDEELSTNSDEAIAPALLVGNVGLWKQVYPSSVYRDATEKMSDHKSEADDVAHVPSASRVFSYRIEEVKAPARSRAPHENSARTARYITHYSDWGYLATVSTHTQIRGIPFGSIFSVSDGPLDNSTGVPYFYISPTVHAVTDLQNFPFASLTLSETGGEFCRKHVIDPADPRCVRLTLTGRMVEVGPEELAFAKEAMFSRNPVMKKWPLGQKWVFMKLVVDQVWLQDWVGEVFLISLDDYFKTAPY